MQLQTAEVPPARLATYYNPLTDEEDEEANTSQHQPPEESPELFDEPEEDGEPEHNKKHLEPATGSKKKGKTPTDQEANTSQQQPAKESSETDDESEEEPEPKKKRLEPAAGSKKKGKTPKKKTHHSRVKC